MLAKAEGATSMDTSNSSNMTWFQQENLTLNNHCFKNTWFQQDMASSIPGFHKTWFQHDLVSTRPGFNKTWLQQDL